MTDLQKGLFLLFFPLVSGCVLAAATGSLGVGYTLSNIAHKTFNHPVQEVSRATTLVLKNMDIEVVENLETDSGRIIKASTRDLEIEVELEFVTSRTTRMNVNASDGLIQKDKATALEIIDQTEKILSG